MVTEIDIFRSAHLLMERYGADAEIFAGMQADACGEAGDLDGKATWLRVIRAIKELRDSKPPDNPAEMH